MPTYALTIAGAAKSLKERSLQIRETVNGRGTFAFDIYSANGAYRPALNAEVIITQDGTRIAAGFINQPAESGVSSFPTDDIVTHVTCVDFNSLADRAFTDPGLVIPAGTLKAALQALDDYLTDYGVTLDAAQVTGPSMPELTFDSAKIADALNQLSALTDYAYVWEIDYNKTLRMFSLGSSAAPFNVVPPDGNARGDITVSPSRNDYANYIILFAGTGTRDVTDPFTGNGVTTVFNLTYTLASHYGYVTYAGNNEPLGAVGEPGAFWEYNPAVGPHGSITRVAGVPTGAISITYVGLFPHRVTADGGASAANRVKKLVTAPDVFDATVAQELANAELVRSQLTPKTVKYRTIRTNHIHPGQTQTITVPARNVSGTYLIQDVTITNLLGSHLVRDVTAIEGTTLQETWRDVVKRWGGGFSTSSAITGGGVSSGGVGGSGTVDILPKWTTSTALGDSLIREGTGTPEGVVTAPIASMFLRKDTGDIYRKATGSGNTGWTLFGAAGSGTVGKLSKWVTTSTLGDSLLSESGSIVSVAGHLHPSLTDTWDLGRYDLLWNQGYLAQLNATLFALNTQTLFGGYSTIGFQAATFPAFVSDGAGTIDFGMTMTPGHFVLVRAHDNSGTITSEFIQVGTLVSGTTYNVTRNLSGLGAKNWAQGVPFLVRGTTGTGRIDLYAYDGKPRIQFVEQGATYNAETHRAVIGNLNGYYGYASDIYGAAFGVPTGGWLKIDPTNGVRIGHNTTTKISLDASGNASFTGSITASSGTIGGFTIGSTELRAWSGTPGSSSNVAMFSNLAGEGNIPVIFASDGSANWVILRGVSSASGVALAAGGFDSATAPFRVTMAGALTATNATITGAITATSGSFAGSITSTSGTIGGWAISSNSLTGGSATLASSGNLTLGTGNDVFRASADDGTYRLWIGHATAGSAAFRVSKTGDFVATSATITGNITANTLDANSGTIGGLTIDGTLTIGGGGSVVAGGGNVVLNSSGLTLAAGTGASNSIIWDNGVTINGWSGSQFLDLNASETRVSQTFRVFGATIDFGTIGSDTGTTLVLNGSGLVKTLSSSERYKEHIQPWQPHDPLAILRAKPIRFDYIEGTKAVVGLSAEDVAAISPELVNLDREGRPDSVRMESLVAHLVIAMRAQQMEITRLQERVGQ